MSVSYAIIAHGYVMTFFFLPTIRYVVDIRLCISQFPVLFDALSARK